MPDTLKTGTGTPTRRWFVFAGIAVALLVSTYGCWIWINSDPPFSQQQYEDGYLDAFRMNTTGPGYMDYKSGFWSMQQGFDDGISDFKRIYQHPNLGPFSYSKIERFRDVLAHIESTDLLDPNVKDRILEQLRMDLSDWESSAETENGG
jgi:hypothetical protein